MENKSYPEDYNDDEIREVKKLVIARLKQIPDNFRLMMGSKNER